MRNAQPGGQTDRAAAALRSPKLVNYAHVIHHLCAGLGLSSARQMALMRIATKSRRFFAPGTASEIWDLLSPAIRSNDPTEAYIAVRFILSTFLYYFCI